MELVNLPPGLIFTQTVLEFIVMEKHPTPSCRLANGTSLPTGPLALGIEPPLPEQDHNLSTGGWRTWFQKDVISFFFLGPIVSPHDHSTFMILTMEPQIAFATMLVSTGANATFPYGRHIRRQPLLHSSSHSLHYTLISSSHQS